MTAVTTFHDTDGVVGITTIIHPHCLPGLRGFLFYADICLRVASRPNGPAIRMTNIHKAVAVTVPIPSKECVQKAVNHCLSSDWLVMSIWEPVLGDAEPF